jgi:hypothetical protein
MAEPQVGAIIESGPSDWQIVQQGRDGRGVIPLSGRWVHPETGRVEVRLVFEDTGVAVSRSLDWQPAETRPDGTWSACLSAPPGGLYRLETRYHPPS